MKKTDVITRLVCSFGVTDESFAIFTTSDKKKCDKWYFFGIFTVTYSSWIVGTIIGTFANSVLPAAVSNSLGIALYALFIALLVPNVKGNVRLLFVVIITAIMNFVLPLFIEPSWALIVSTLLGAAIGMFVVPDEEDVSEEVAE